MNRKLATSSAFALVLLSLPVASSAATLQFITQTTLAGATNSSFSNTGNVFGFLGSTAPNAFTTENIFTTNNDFQNPAPTAGINSPISNWTSSGALEVLAGTGVNSANRFVEMSANPSGNNNTANGVLTTANIAVTPNQLYGLSFDFAGGDTGNSNTARQRSNLVQVQYRTSTNNGSTFGNFVSLGFVTASSTAAADSTTDFSKVYSWNLNFGAANVVQFRFTGVDVTGGNNANSALTATDADGEGGRIDNVVLHAVPLPPIVWMLGASMLGWLGFSSRKRLAN